jgi:hypothetical protein
MIVAPHIRSLVPVSLGREGFCEGFLACFNRAPVFLAIVCKSASWLLTSYNGVIIHRCHFPPLPHEHVQADIKIKGHATPATTIP